MEEKIKFLNKKIDSKYQVTMMHGRKMSLFPFHFSRKVLKLFINAKKKLVIIKNGDHSLSNKKCLKEINKRAKINYLTNFFNIWI